MEMDFNVDRISLFVITAGVLICLESVTRVQTALMEPMNMIAHRLKVVLLQCYTFSVFHCCVKSAYISLGRVKVLHKNLLCASEC